MVFENLVFPFSIPTLELCIVAGTKVLLRAPWSQAHSCLYHCLSRPAIFLFKYEFIKNIYRNEN